MAKLQQDLTTLELDRSKDKKIAKAEEDHLQSMIHGLEESIKQDTGTYKDAIAERDREKITLQERLDAAEEEARNL